MKPKKIENKIKLFKYMNNMALQSEFSDLHLIISPVEENGSATVVESNNTKRWPVGHFQTEWNWSLFKEIS